MFQCSPIFRPSTQTSAPKNTQDREIKLCQILRDIVSTETSAPKTTQYREINLCQILRNIVSRDCVEYGGHNIYHIYHICPT